MSAQMLFSFNLEGYPRVSREMRWSYWPFRFCQ